MLTAEQVTGKMKILYCSEKRWLELYDFIINGSDPRKRPIGETAKLVEAGILSTRFAKKNHRIILDEGAETNKVISMAGVGDLVVIQANDVHKVISDVLEFKEIIMS